MGGTKDEYERQLSLGWSPNSDKFVCRDCVGNHALARVVDQNVESTRCDFCDEEADEPIAAPVDCVTEHMAECINREYTDPANELPYESAEGGYQGEVLDAWELMEAIGFEPDSAELLEEVVDAFSGQGWCRIDYFALSDEDRLDYGWDRFKIAVKHKRRFTFWSSKDGGAEEYHPDYLPVGRMLNEIAGIARGLRLIKKLPKGSRVWRLRVHEASKQVKGDCDLSPPPRSKATQANRMSPAGIPMFYGCDDFDTAYIETVDAAKDAGKRVTGGVFETLRTLRILDLAELPPHPSFFDLGADMRHESAFLRDFARDVALPIERDGKEHIEYVPTQAFSEYVRYKLRDAKGKRVHGIRYRSAKNRRPCYVLFCEQRNCIEELPPYTRAKQWLKLDPSSVRSREIRAT